jgi:hypothetical protein
MAPLSPANQMTSMLDILILDFFASARVQGSGFRVQDPGFRVQGLGLRA